MKKLRFGLICVVFSLLCAGALLSFAIAEETGDGTRSTVVKDGKKRPEVKRNAGAVSVTLLEVNFAGNGLHQTRKTGAGSYSYKNETFGASGDTVIGAVGYYWKSDPTKGVVLNDPVCYTKGSTPTVIIKIEVKTAKAVTLKLLGDGAKGCYQVPTNEVTLNGVTSGTHTATLPLSTAIYDGVASCYLGFQWKYGVNAAPSATFATTRHLLFITYASPHGSTVTAKRVHWCARTCHGKENLKSKDQIPRAMQLGVQTEGQGHFKGGTGPANPWTLFDPGVKGPCTTYAQVMMLGLRMLGAPTNKTGGTSVTSHAVTVNTWLGANVNYSILRWFDEWGGGPWVNEGVCAVVTDDKGLLYYDVAGGSSYGPKLAHDKGAQYATRPTELVANQWREPVPSHGPIMMDWYFPPMYSNAIDTALPNLVQVKAPNGGETITVGTQVKVTSYTAGLQGNDLQVYYILQGTNQAKVIGTANIAAAGSEAGNFSKETEVVWDTTGVSPGKYRVFTRLKDQSTTRYADFSDASFEIKAKE